MVDDFPDYRSALELAVSSEDVARLCELVRHAQPSRRELSASRSRVFSQGRFGEPVAGDVSELDRY
jgi:hypothetical protein